MAVKKTKTTKDQKKPTKKAAKNPSGGEEFTSLSGKKFDSKEVYLETKLKRTKSKFSLGYKLFEALIKKGAKKTTVNIQKEIDSVVKKENPKAESPKVFYLADNLITNRRKGYLGLIKGGENFRIENTQRKNLPKNDKSNGTIDAITAFDLVKS